LDSLYNSHLIIIKPVKYNAMNKLVYKVYNINGFNTIISRLIDRKGLIVLFNNTGVAPLLERKKQIANSKLNKLLKY